MLFIVILVNATDTRSGRQGERDSRMKKVRQRLKRKFGYVRGGLYRAITSAIASSVVLDYTMFLFLLVRLT